MGMIAWIMGADVFGSDCFLDLRRSFYFTLTLSASFLEKVSATILCCKIVSAQLSTLLTLESVFSSPLSSLYHSFTCFLVSSLSVCLFICCILLLCSVCPCCFLLPQNATALSGAREESRSS